MTYDDALAELIATEAQQMLLRFREMVRDRFGDNIDAGFVNLSIGVEVPDALIIQSPKYTAPIHLET